MKILITVDPEIPVPPKLYGGIERVVHQLGQGYQSLGHEVILLAHPESNSTNFHQRHAWPALKSRGTRNIYTNAKKLRHVVKSEQPDLIHSFSRIAYLPFIWEFKGAIIQTFQRKISNTTTRLAKNFFGERLHLTACGRHMFQSLSKPEHWSAVPNCCDTEFLTQPTTTGRTHLAFLGRIEPIKGILEAIKFAQSVQTPLVIAGNIEPEWESFFENEVKPHIDGTLIQYIGTVDDIAKRNLLSGAIGFLMLIQWEEPFGIVMAEALACGAPVIALNRGSVPEIVEHGINGIVGDSIASLIQTYPLVDKISEQVCRMDAVNRFSIDAVASLYLKILTSNDALK
ncbi:MAG TPA: glycosyltransferase family 4 protein [Flavobacteriales bacterium]|nr:glycosyltransferase family 4 protein [Flavobacteriales bacterium]